jgi:hypothetical protein
MNRTYLLLKEIQKNPYIYVGKLSLERLYAFISGYQYSERERDPLISEGIIKIFGG